MTEFTLSSMRLNETQNHDGFKVVWLSSKKILPEALNYFADYLTECSTSDGCKKYIEKFRSDRIILLVLIDFCESLVEFRSLSQIQSIYILKAIPDEQIASSVIQYFSDESKLIEKLRRDILVTYRHELPITISSLEDFKIGHGLLDFDKKRYTFLWNQFFLHSLVSDASADMNELRISMMEQCRIETQNDEIRRKNMDELDETCNEQTILNWYAKEGFFFELVNRILRTRNIHLIWKFQYFFKLAHKKLKELMIEQQSRRKHSRFYRGQIITMDELKLLAANEGKLMSVNSMMSTSLAEDAARAFFGGAELGVLFRITVPNTSGPVVHPFANISQFSKFQHEEEFLFFVGAVFRIDSVRQENESTWIIDLTLCNENVQQLEQVFDAIREQLDSITCWQDASMKVQSYRLFEKYFRILTGYRFSLDDLVTMKLHMNLYDFLTISGNCEKEVEFIGNLFQNQFIDEPKRLVFHIIIGLNYFQLGYFDSALFHYGIAYTLLNKDSRLMAYLYMHIADVMVQEQMYDVALSHYRKTLKIFARDHYGGRDVSETNRKIADVYRRQNNHLAADIYEERADKNDSNRTERTNFDVEKSLRFFLDRFMKGSNDSLMQKANDLYSIGACLAKTNRFREAQEKFLQAKDLFESQLSSSPYFIICYSRVLLSIAGTYALLKDLFNALITLKKTIDLLEGLHC